jgi:phage terminase Nu1 subunit (DNA packaging protein)
MTAQEVMALLNVNKQRVTQLKTAGMITVMKGNIYDAESVQAYKLKRGDKKAGRYPKKKEE